nr:hypothetical protein [Minwuia thermotolerans]
MNQNEPARGNGRDLGFDTHRRGFEQPRPLAGFIGFRKTGPAKGPGIADKAQAVDMVRQVLRHRTVVEADQHEVAGERVDLSEAVVGEADPAVRADNDDPGFGAAGARAMLSDMIEKVQVPAVRQFIHDHARPNGN